MEVSRPVSKVTHVCGRPTVLVVLAGVGARAKARAKAQAKDRAEG